MEIRVTGMWVLLAVPPLINCVILVKLLNLGVLVSSTAKYTDLANDLRCPL